MRLFWDTETSGLWRGDLPPDHPSQPNLVQLGAKLFDASWRCTSSMTVLIRPDGWSIEPDAERHHGISEARCNRHGVPLVAALSLFKAMTENARQAVAHNVTFDRGVIRASLDRCGASGLWWQKKADAFVCTMEAATPVCQLPGDFGRFKFPSLEEAHRHFYPGDAFSTQHDAEQDLEACVRVFQALDKIGAVPSPEMGRRL